MTWFLYGSIIDSLAYDTKIFQDDPPPNDAKMPPPSIHDATRGSGMKLTRHHLHAKFTQSSLGAR